MENLNAEQIKKALECCTRGRKSKEDRPCLDCPYNECNLVGGTSERQIKGTCQGWLMKDALALITSQEQRIKELAEENENLHAICRELTQKLHDMQKRGSFTLTVNFDEEQVKKIESECLACIERDINEIKADTVRKMQERLELDKRFCHDPAFLGVEQRLIMDVIDEIAKEMLEGEK